MKPSDYELQALRGIEAWREPEDSWLKRASNSVQARIRDVSEQVRKIPGVDWTIDNVVSGLISLTNEISQDLVWREAIMQEFQGAGHAVESPSDVRKLDLEQVDTRLDGLAAKYKGLAAVEGMATGAIGLAGILPDIVALLALNLRAAGEYATYCGFDITHPNERLYALHILNASTKPREEIARSVPVQLHHTPGSYARHKTLDTVERFAVSGTTGALARSIALRVTRNKLAQVIPVAGALVAGGYNSLYTHTVCDIAHHLYRERFLVSKYGEGL